MEKTYDDNEIEIDLLELLGEFRRRIWMILGIIILFGGVAGAFSAFVLTPQYKSTAMVYILSKETTLTSLADLQIGSQLTKDYSVMITSRPVLEEVIEKQKLSLSYNQLKRMIRISNPADTRILNMSVSDTDPVRAKAIVDAVAKASSDYIGDIMEMIPPKIIENGVVPDNPTSPNIKKNVALGGLALSVAACGFITLQVIMNDTIRSEEDVSRYLGISVLAVIPENNGEEKDNPDKGSEGKKSRKKRKTQAKRAERRK